MKQKKSTVFTAIHRTAKVFHACDLKENRTIDSCDESGLALHAEESIQNSIWKATSIEETPDLALRSWRIYEVSSKLWEDRTRHFSGYNITEMEGRASTHIVEFDEDKMIGRTESGRIYNLVGPPGYDSDATYVWDWYRRRNQLFDIIDVTKEYVSYAAPTTA